MGIAFNNAADGGANGGSSNTLTYSYTCGSGANRLLVVHIMGANSGGADDISSVTYAGVSMTLLGKVDVIGQSIHYDYYLLGPATGTNNVVITSTSSHTLKSGAADWTGDAQIGQPDAVTTHESGANVSSLTTSLTTVADNCWTILSVGGYDGTTPTAGAGLTRRVFAAAFSEWALFDSGGDITPAGSYSMTTNKGGSSHIGHIVGSFSPVASAGFQVAWAQHSNVMLSGGYAT